MYFGLKLEIVSLGRGWRAAAAAAYCNRRWRGCAWGAVAEGLVEWAPREGLTSKRGEGDFRRMWRQRRQRSPWRQPDIRVTTPYPARSGVLVRFPPRRYYYLARLISLNVCRINKSVRPGPARARGRKRRPFKIIIRKKKKKRKKTDRDFPKPSRRLWERRQTKK